MSFWLVAVGLTLLAVAFITLPLLWTGRRKNDDGPLAEAVNVALLQEQFAELENQRHSGSLGEQDYNERRQELELRLLDNVAPLSHGTTNKRFVWPVVLVAMALPVVAWFLYQYLGSGEAWQLTQRYQSLSEQMTAGQVDDEDVLGFVADLALFTREETDSDWLFLQSRLYMQMGMFPAAAQAYGRLAAREPGNADLLARQAQALYLASGRKLDGEVAALIQQVLAINPHQATVLGLQGMHAFENADYSGAIQSWQQALAGMPAGSPSKAVLERGISQARAALGEAQPNPGGETPAAGFSEGIRVRVELAQSAAVQPGSTVYVIASAPSGGMPYAVVRLPVEDLPTELSLDDSSAMAPGNSLSRQNQVRVTARVSVSGDAIAQAGDWQGQSVVLTPEKLPELVAIRIDQQI